MSNTHWVLRCAITGFMFASQDERPEGAEFPAEWDGRECYWAEENAPALYRVQDGYGAVHLSGASSAQADRFCVEMQKTYPDLGFHVRRDYVPQRKPRPQETCPVCGSDSWHGQCQYDPAHTAPIRTGGMFGPQA